MNRSVTIACGAAALAFAASASAGAKKPPEPKPLTQGASQTTRAPYVPASPDRDVSRARPLFTIGGAAVVLWAPVEPPYSSRNNRTAAANPLWETDAY